MKHHYVPACYLRSFIDAACPREYEPYRWVVGLKTAEIRRRSPDNTARLTDYYAVAQGEDRYEVEKYVSAAESEASPVLAAILGDYHTVEENDKRVLSRFSALQIVRVPQFRDRMESSSRVSGRQLAN